MSNKADIIEIFSSIQGEGPYVGERQIFIRFSDCNLNCVYCDTAKFVKSAGLTVEQVISRVKTLNRNTKHKTVSVTGGEPLIYAGFLKILLPRLKREGFNIYLETNATLPQALKKIINFIDTISADIKPPSVTREKPQWGKHLDFLKTAIRKNVFVKIVVSDTLKMYDFNKAVSLIKKIDADIPFVIQPVTSGRRIKVSTDRLFNLQGHALKFLRNVLIIPQVHKILEVK